jgi:phenylacetate-CoA ligase
MYSGDTMSTSGRELIEGEFGIPVVSQYNAVEAFKIAFTCEARSGFHLHEDLCHVWLADAHGRPVEPGQRGEVVLSNLVNRGTVLLNYRLGDVARLTDEPCRCGRPTRRLLDLEGRVDQIFELGGGAFVYPTAVWRLFRDAPGILRYQVVQLARDRFELRYVEATPGAAERAIAEVLPQLGTLLHGARVDAVAVPELPSTAGGKFHHLVPLQEVGG